MTANKENRTATADDRHVSQKGSTDPELRHLGEVLVGTWKLSGEAQGEIRFEWAEGGHFLVQHYDIHVLGRTVKGIEFIGRLHRLGEPPSEEIWTRVYSFVDGLTLDYVYELVGNTLTIWFGCKGSSNFYRGKLSDDGKTLTGAWQWPGGGYQVTNTKVS